MKLSAEHLTKTFGEKRAVDNVSFTLTGGVYGLLGPNGAGKTTLMKMMVDLLDPTDGQVTLNGVDIRRMGAAYRARLGYMPQEIGVYKNFTARRFLQYIAALKGLSGKKADRRVEELLELVGLSGAEKKKLGGFSGGMLRRVGIAQTLLNDPKILILDEPTAELDPQERIRFRNIISQLSENRIVLLSTHIISDMEFIAGEVIMLREGAVLKIDTTQRLIEEMEGRVWVARMEKGQLASLHGQYAVGNILQRENGVEVRLVGEVPPSFPARAVRPILEDVFSFYFGGDLL